ALNKDDNTMTEWGSMYDAEDVFFHAPQIMAMVACEAGLELYLRWNSYEGIHYAIWREMGSQWIAIQDDYEYLMAY
ncbi:MAG: hypothetical protein IK092_00135, partial [Muribaculaceae bacterium]|nr:hypothetical protein [Muribaculaceae bacterium]